MWRVNSSERENLRGQFSTGQAYGRSLGGTLAFLVGSFLFSLRMLSPARLMGLWLTVMGYGLDATEQDENFCGC